MSNTGLSVLTVVLHEEDESGIHDLARHFSDPCHPEYGQYIDRATLMDMASPPAGARDACMDWFRARGMEIFLDDIHPQMFFIQATNEQLTHAFGPYYRDRLAESDRHCVPRGKQGFPAVVAGWIKAIHLTHTDSPARNALRVRGVGLVDAPVTMDADLSPSAFEDAKIPDGLGGFSVADIRQTYDFPEEWDGAGETIALLNLAGAVSDEDLLHFWQANGITRELPVRVDIGGPRVETSDFLARLEATMGTAWLGALAPGAKLVIYRVNTDLIADPWSAMVAYAIADTEHPPTILVSTWTTPEDTYYRTFGARVFGDFMDQAAALGITSVAAAGDWGVYSGRPSVVRDGGQRVADAAWPRGVFPAVEEQVLAVGGTMITARHPLTEMAWSGPLPPDPHVRKSMPFELLAGSGGFSEQVPQPWWQDKLIGTQRTYARGSNIPAVAPYGRGYPDVALMAAGPSVQISPDRGLSSVGYQLVIDDRWIDYAGGTSLAAPVWATIIARMNQARRARAGCRVGFVNPLLYQLGNAQGTFRDIAIGNSDVLLKVIVDGGSAHSFRLIGYDAQKGWDPVTGLGVPVVSRLIAHALEVPASRA